MTTVGWRVLRAAAQFCANASAIHYDIFPTSGRNLTIFDGYPVLDRDDIDQEARAIHALVKAKYQAIAGAFLFFKRMLSYFI